ncbi:hypothetical protein [Kibdelosporangium phytohabitans]|uniref:Uncharacterized protein n=1 Tax=Kibdelosporangium phytohabitans TaxID=860235 RepID=A0A0N9I8Z9_9PSEU|nr:hypothetical protein [Kibdelosporangium phytohabitans]ALG12860.1 hypothetical protein AOZ06_43775 [Kibdelosporangium phytohabitans]MBE1464558.1 hypothetical protein [Kibdelosporangium phytohabitans]
MARKTSSGTFCCAGSGRSTTTAAPASPRCREAEHGPIGFARSSTADEFIGHLRHLFPEANDIAPHDAYLLMVASSLPAFSDNPRPADMTTGRLHTNDFEQRSTSLVTFLEGGIARLAEAESEAGAGQAVGGSAASVPPG